MLLAVPVPGSNDEESNLASVFERAIEAEDRASLGGSE